jgi:hypothetical protein
MQSLYSSARCGMMTVRNSVWPNYLAAAEFSGSFGPKFVRGDDY